MAAKVFLIAINLCFLIQASTISAARPKSEPCSPYPHVFVKHGSITPLPGQEFVVHCEEGYTRVYSHKIRCFRGNWTDTRQPKCRRKEGVCNEPPAVPHADIFGDGREVDSMILYQCHSGYIMLGEDTRTCLRSQHWSGTNPVCMAESEPLQNIADRVQTDFIEEMSNYSSDSVIEEGRLLDQASIKDGLELVILMDRSSSIDPEDFKLGKEFIKFLLQKLGLKNGNNPSGTRVALLTFGTDVDIVFNVDNVTITGLPAANLAIDGIKPNGGGTNIEGALTSIYVDVRPLLREKAKKAIFLITDGEPNIGTPGISPEEVANQLKNEDDGFEIFTVGIGKGINRKFLSDVASEPIASHVFVIDKYSDLRDIMKIIQDRPPPVPAIDSGRCGHIENEKNFLKRWPWLAAIYTDFSDEEGNSNLCFCTGALICSQWVITAAACLFETRNINGSHTDVRKDSNATFVILGEQNLSVDTRSQMSFYAEKIVIHPKFDPENDLLSNLALLKLNVPAPMSRFRPICLPPTDKIEKLHLNLNIDAAIAGWGLPPSKHSPPGINGGTVKLQLSTTSINLAEKGECSRFSGSQDTIFCAGHGLKTCIGDLGSPLIAVDPTTKIHHVLGILSRRSACEQFYNQYTELTSYMNWINLETNQCHSEHWMA